MVENQIPVSWLKVAVDQFRPRNQKFITEEEERSKTETNENYIRK